MIDPKHKMFLDSITKDIQDNPVTWYSIEKHLRGKFRLGWDAAYSIVREYRELLEKGFSK